MRTAPGGEPFVLHVDDLAGQVTVSFVPPAPLVTEYLNIDSLLIYELQARRTQDQRAISINEPCEVRVFHDVQFLGCNEVTVYVNDLHATLSNKHFTTFCGSRLK